MVSIAHNQPAVDLYLTLSLSHSLAIDKWTVYAIIIEKEKKPKKMKTHWNWMRMEEQGGKTLEHTFNTINSQIILSAHAWHTFFIRTHFPHTMPSDPIQLNDYIREWL